MPHLLTLVPFSCLFYGIFICLFQSLTQPNVYLSHEVFKRKRGAWAIIPIIEDVHRDLIREKTKFVLLLEPNSNVNLSILLKYLSQQDYQKVREFLIFTVLLYGTKQEINFQFIFHTTFLLLYTFLVYRNNILGIQFMIKNRPLHIIFHFSKIHHNLNILF